MSGGASEIKDIPMAETMAYGTLGMQQEEGKDVSVSQCLAGGQQMKEGEDGANEIVEGVDEPTPN